MFDWTHTLAVRHYTTDEAPLMHPYSYTLKGVSPSRVNTFLFQKGELACAYTHSPFDKGRVLMKSEKGEAPFERWTLARQALKPIFAQAQT